MSLISTKDSTFGELHGECIENKSSILSEIDACLNSTTPDIEYILADSQIKLNEEGQKLGILNNIASFFGRCGHAAIRYKYYPDSNENTNQYQDIVMNIVGPKVKDCAMVNFISTQEYLFGTAKLDKECEQGGIYNRRFYGIRLENVPKTSLKAMHYHFKSLQYKEKGSNTSFKLIGGRSNHFFWKYLPFESDINGAMIVSQAGNCSMWTSSGLVAAGLLPRCKMFPKSTFIELYERQMRINPNNIKIVKYQQIEQCFKYQPKARDISSLVNPLLPIRNIRFWNLDDLCDAIVYVPNNSKTAILIDNKDNKRRISVHFWLRNADSFLTAIIMIYILFYFPFSMQTNIIIAALWVIIHYWIY